MSNHFFFFLLQSFLLQDQIDLHTLGQAVKGINIGEVKKLSFGLPDENEQMKIAEHLVGCIELINGYEKDLSKQVAIKTALMQDLLTGKVRVTSLLNEQKNSA